MAAFGFRIRAACALAFVLAASAGGTTANHDDSAGEIHIDAGAASGGTEQVCAANQSPHIPAANPGADAQNPHESDAPADIEELLPERVSALAEKQARISIKSNAQNADVFLNGQLQGTTTLVLSGIQAGQYNVRVEKRGYAAAQFYIAAENGTAKTFYIPLQKQTGRISTAGLPHGAALFVDGEKTGTNAEIPAGTHTVRAECFGYEPAEAEINVQTGGTAAFPQTLEAAAFRVTAFSAEAKSRKKAAITIDVAARGNGTLTVTDGAGAAVLTRALTFSKQRTAVTFKGAAGTYRAHLSAGADELDAEFSLGAGAPAPTHTAHPGADSAGEAPPDSAPATEPPESAGEQPLPWWKRWLLGE